MQISEYFQISNAVNGGAMRDRTADLLRARQALSQLSYSPLSLTDGYRYDEEW